MMILSFDHVFFCALKVELIPSIINIVTSRFTKMVLKNKDRGIILESTDSIDIISSDYRQYKI